MTGDIPLLLASVFDLLASAPSSAPAGSGAGLWSTPSLIALLTLTALEVVLGIDNVVFLAILAGKLERSKQALARLLGLGLAMGMRILMLVVLWAIASPGEGKIEPPDLFNVFGIGFSVKDLILLGGGLFLIAKATYEMHDKLEGPPDDTAAPKKVASFGLVIVQIVLVDIVFSLDSVITAVAMAEHIQIMVAAVVIAVLIMMVSAGSISRFVERHPSIKMLALSFLLLIGVLLVADGLGTHINKGYIYFAMAFSLFVEILNMRLRKKSAPVRLNDASLEEAEAGARS